MIFSPFSSLSCTLPLPDLNNPHSAYHDDAPLLLILSEGGGGGGESLGRLVLMLAIDLLFGSHVILLLELEAELRFKFELSGELVDFSFTAKIPESTSTESVT